MMKTKSTWIKPIVTLVAIGAAVAVVMAAVKPIENESPIAWQTDFSQAMLQAAELDKEVLLRFSASWCPPCRVMDAKVWPSENVANTVNANYVAVDIDSDRVGANRIAARYGVQALPTVLRINADGEVIKRANFMTAGQMVKFLNDEA